MKRWMMAAVIGCGLACHCTDDRTGDPVGQQTVTRRVRIEAAAPGTRTELAGDGYNVLWSPGDRIGV